MHLKSTLTLTFCLVSTFLLAQSSFETAINHLNNSEKYTTSDLSDVIISDEYESSHNGVTHLYLKQRHLGIEVMYSMTNFNLREGEILRSKGSFITDLAQKINTNHASITAIAALKKVIDQHKISGASPNILEASNLPDQTTIFEKGDIALENIEARLVYFQEKDKIKLSWEISIYEKNGDHWWKSIVDAQSGDILSEHDHVLHCSFRVKDMERPKEKK